MMKNELIEQVRRELQANSDEKARESGKRFFKEEVMMYGMKSVVATKISKEYFKIAAKRPKGEILEMCEELWKSGYMEESFIACNWSYFVRKDFTPDDFPVFERWVVSYIGNWASCDTLCNHTIGAFLEMYPEFLPELKRWAKSSGRWMKRASAVSLIIPARKGMFLPEIMEIADILLTDKDDMVQKGYGWMLKVASKEHQKEVFEYVMKNRATMPRTALRYAIENMPAELKAQAMTKY